MAVIADSAKVNGVMHSIKEIVGVVIALVVS